MLLATRNLHSPLASWRAVVSHTVVYSIADHLYSHLGHPLKQTLRLYCLPGKEALLFPICQMLNIYPPEFEKQKTLPHSLRGLGLWYLTSLSTIFQLYHGG
jgi:hypothetical protein